MHPYHGPAPQKCLCEHLVRRFVGAACMVEFKVLMARIGGKMKAALRVSEVMAD